MQKKNIMGIRSSVILNRYLTNYLMLEELSEEDEHRIDESAETSDEMYFVKAIGKNIIRIPARDIFLYGEIDVNNKSDLQLLQNADIITQEVNQAAYIPSDFDYETGTVYADKEGIYRTHDTWNKIDWFKFNHCLIGKPKRIIIYRINKHYVPRDRSIKRDNS